MKTTLEEIIFTACFVVVALSLAVPAAFLAVHWHDLRMMVKQENDWTQESVRHMRGRDLAEIDDYWELEQAERDAIARGLKPRRVIEQERAKGEMNLWEDYFNSCNATVRAEAAEALKAMGRFKDFPDNQPHSTK